jgi:hypothetical protein
MVEVSIGIAPEAISAVMRLLSVPAPAIQPVKNIATVSRASPAAWRLILGGEGTLKAASTKQINAATMKIKRHGAVIAYLLLTLESLDIGNKLPKRLI